MVRQLRDAYLVRIPHSSYFTRNAAGNPVLHAEWDEPKVRQFARRLGTDGILDVIDQTAIAARRFEDPTQEQLAVHAWAYFAAVCRYRIQDL